MNNAPPGLALFVYGTLKREFPAHARFFGDGAKVGEAVVRGSLFDLLAGYPALVVPGDDILATGTADVPADAKKQRGMFSASREAPLSEETVFGEVVCVRDPNRTLPALDAFEGFDPNGESLYRRVLIPAWTDHGEPSAAWAYVMESPPGERIAGGRWPRP